MLTTLLDSPAALAAVIAVLSVLNYAVGALALREHSRQPFVERDSYLPPGPIGTIRSNRAQLALPFVLAIVVIAVTLSADPLTREIFGGGYLVVLMAGCALNVTGWLTARALADPRAAEGRIRYSAMYRYRSSSAQALGLALFSGAVGILFGSLAFGVGSLFLLATAAGYFRRERQASRRAILTTDSQESSENIMVAGSAAAAVFRDALHGLHRGDFSRLEKLFDDDPGCGRAPIVDWCEERRFRTEAKALAEALTCACFLGRTGVATYLLTRGVDPSGGAGTGLNAFHWAVNRGQLETVRLLIRWKAPVEPRSMYGGNVLDTAVWSAINEPRPDHLQIVEELLNAGARLENEGWPTGHERIDALLKRHGPF
jgi:hypothetical protein